MALTSDLPAVADHSLVLDRYRLGRRLGRGGFGTVFEAYDERLERLVAVKVIPAATSAAEVEDRAAREALAAARLDHPGIVAVYDAGEEPGARYLVSELVRGRTLADLEADDALSDRDVLRVGLALADALAHAHERGVVHRDVKPQNVMVPERATSGRGAAKLTDFGVAHLVDDDALTRTGDVVGTLVYMAPEQAEGRRVDPRTDLYALGLVLYEALAGVNPVRGASPAATARKVGSVLPPLARHRPDLPPELCAALDRAVRPKPGERGTVGDVADALVDALDDVEDVGGAIARHPLEGPRRLPAPPRVVRRGAAGVAAGALVTGALVTQASPLDVPPLAAGALAAAVVALLPRLGWLAAAFGLVLALMVDGRTGAAALVAAAALPVPLLARRAGVGWSLPALAPLLGLATLAFGYPALAGRARTAASRAGLGALGAWWLVLAEPVLGRAVGLGTGERAPTEWSGEIAVTAERILLPALADGALLLAIPWALAAAVLPWLVRGRGAGADLLGACLWAAALALAMGALADRLGRPEPAGLALGACAAAALAFTGARVGAGAGIGRPDDEQPYSETP